MGEVSELLPPALLADRHDIGDFHSGEASLDDWLKRRARANQVSGASRTYVVCDGRRVVGYYAVAPGVVAVESAPGRFRRNMPNPISVAVLARLAVDRGWQGRGIGRACSGTPRAAWRMLPIRSAFELSLSTPYRRRRRISMWHWASMRVLASR